MAGEGLVSMTPTSIAYSGTSASINADGGVDFSAVDSVSMNGVFTSDYVNYRLVFTATGTGSFNAYFRMRASGTDASGTDYQDQYLLSSGTTINGARATGETAGKAFIVRTTPMGGELYVYGPTIAQATVTRVVQIEPDGNAAFRDQVAAHGVSSVYDGITIIVTAVGESMTGNLHVFGYEE